VRDETSKSQEDNEESQAEEKEVVEEPPKDRKEIRIFYLTGDRIFGIRFLRTKFSVILLKYDERR